MADIKKGARAYYADTDYRRDGVIEAYDKIDDINIVANPEDIPTEDLNSITIGTKTYRVNDVRVSKILGLRFTINNGGTYNAKMPLVSFVNEYGEAAQVSTYEMTCDKPVQYGGLSLSGSAGVQTQNLPAVFTVLFNAEFNIEDFANIKLENSGLFSGDIAKNIKLEYSVSGTDWLEIFDKVSIDWSSTVHIYNMSTGEEVTTKSPIPEPTAADAGKVLSVDSSGKWELDNIPLAEEVIFSPTTPLLPNSSGVIDFNINNLNNYKFAAVYHRFSSDTNQMSCWFVPVGYIKYCLDNNLYMALTGFDNRYILFTFSVVNDVTSIITSNGSDDAIYKIILYK